MLSSRKTTYYLVCIGGGSSWKIKTTIDWEGISHHTIKYQILWQQNYAIPFSTSCHANYFLTQEKEAGL